MGLIGEFGGIKGVILLVRCDWRIFGVNRVILD